MPKLSGSARITSASLFLVEYDPSLLLLPGHPLDAPRDYAAATGFDAVIIVGSGGAGLPKRRRRKNTGKQRGDEHPGNRRTRHG